MSRIFDEKFEATGFDETGWSETVGSGSTVDEDYAVSNVDPEPSGWQTKGLRCLSTTVKFAYIANSQDLGTNKFFFRTEFVIVSEDLANTEQRRIIQLRANGSVAFRAILEQVSGDLVLAFEIHEAGLGGSSTDLTDTTVLSLDTRYRLEMKWDIDADTWDILLDGSSIFSGTLTGNSATTQMDEIHRLGLTHEFQADAEVLFDLIAATATIDEADVVAGGDTIILTLTNTIWVASGGTFDAIRQDIIDGLDSAQVEATGWNAEVRDKEVVGAVVRTSDLVVTITLTAQAAYDITAQETITATIPASAIEDTSPITAAPTFTVDFVVVISAAITGTITPSSTEAQIISGGRTIIITLTADTWVASGGTFDGIRQDIIDGLDSAQSELTGWNNEVRDNEVVTAVVRTSPTVVTITLTAQAAYNITDTETITVTVPASALVTSGSPVVATPTFSVTEIPVATVSGTAVPSSTEAQIVAGARTIIITLADDEWVASGATFNAIRQDIIDGLDSAQVEATGWNAEVRDKEVVTAVVRTNATVVTITLTAQAAYDITADETITVTVPASALDQTALPITATPTFAVTFISPIPGPGDPDPFESISGVGLGGISRNHTPPGIIINR